MGKKPDIPETDEDYMTAWCRIIVERAIEDLHSDRLYVALYKGIAGGTGWSLGLNPNQRVIDLLDLRERSYSPTGNAELLFDTAKKKIYIPSGLSREQRMAVGEAAENRTRIGELTNNLATRSMPVFHVA